jgi:hypothetical protein
LQDRKDQRDLAARVEDGAGMGGDQKETRSFIKLNLVALAFTLAGFAPSCWRSPQSSSCR